MFKVLNRQFVAYFHFVDWSCLSLGLHVDWRCPNIEIHLPFGFIRIGWQCTYESSVDEFICLYRHRTFGIKPNPEKDVEAIKQAFADEEETEIKV